MDTYRSEIVLKCGKIENKDAAILNIASNLAANQFLISLPRFFSNFFFSWNDWEPRKRRP